MFVPSLRTLALTATLACTAGASADGFFSFSFNFGAPLCPPPVVACPPAPPVIVAPAPVYAPQPLYVPRRHRHPRVAPVYVPVAPAYRPVVVAPGPWYR